MKLSTIKENPTPGFNVKSRYILAIMCALGLFNMYSTRNNINIAIVAMVNATTSYARVENTTEICPKSSNYTTPITNGVFTWNSAEQGLVIGAYFYGYVISNIPGAWLARKFGFKLVMGTALLLSSLITVLIPTVAYINFKLLVALRILLGLFQGVTFPTAVGVWSKWAPPQERTFLNSVSVSGATLGTVFICAVAGEIASQWGWEAIFYFTGAVAFLWTVLWFWIIYDEPSTHPRISKQEKSYITESINLENLNYETAETENIPWKSIFTSGPLLACVLGIVSGTYGDYVLCTMLPTYMATILNFNIAISGVYLAVPYVLKWFTMNIVSYLSDVIRSKGWLSTLAIRKINQTIVLLGGACIVLAGYVGCNVKAAVILFCLAITFLGFAVPGCEANVIDIAPRYAGIIYSLCNTAANCCGFLAPQIAGFILLKGNDQMQWRLVFWTTTAGFVVGTASYLFLASADIQNWARGKKMKLCENKY